jgi:hypothetical protein
MAAVAGVTGAGVGVTDAASPADADLYMVQLAASMAALEVASMAEAASTVVVVSTEAADTVVVGTGNRGLRRKSPIG